MKPVVLLLPSQSFGQIAWIELCHFDLSLACQDSREDVKYSLSLIARGDA
jgi:hypothetical protein